MIIKPAAVSFIVGQYVSFQVELRADNGLLFSHPKELADGFYKDPSASFKLSVITDFKVTKGTLPGTYTITISSQKAIAATNIDISYVNEVDGKWYVATKKLSVTAVHDVIDYIVASDLT